MNSIVRNNPGGKPAIYQPASPARFRGRRDVLHFLDGSAITRERAQSAMPERLMVHPLNPQARLVEKAAVVLRAGGLALVPTDAGYALAWSLNGKDAEDRVLRLRELDSRHPFTLLCRQLS
jgi:hypothetical protein